MIRIATLAALAALSLGGWAATTHAGGAEIRNCGSLILTVQAFDSTDIVHMVPASTVDVRPRETGFVHCSTERCTVDVGWRSSNHSVHTKAYRASGGYCVAENDQGRYKAPRIYQGTCLC